MKSTSLKCLQKDQVSPAQMKLLKGGQGIEKVELATEKVERVMR